MYNASKESNLAANSKEQTQSNPKNSVYWSKHRCALIAYEAKFIYQRNQSQKNASLEENQSNNTKNKVSKNKINKLSESSFINFSEEESADFEVKHIVQNYDNLKKLFFSPQNKDYLAVRQFIQHLLELKHSTIVSEFCSLYDALLPYIKSVELETVTSQKLRNEWLEEVRDIMVNWINDAKIYFPWFSKFLAEDIFAMKKLILVELYCLTAQKFNFHVNEFYSEAFDNSEMIEKKISKKLKKDNS